ncbi:MAG: hypothetical protein K0Q49_1122 [Haloplasmataceae bacterium]|jgi:hypothetical protein|nr:hypothetical protein [Haloplasmataceae bacterium]
MNIVLGILLLIIYSIFFLYIIETDFINFIVSSIVVVAITLYGFIVLKYNNILFFVIFFCFIIIGYIFPTKKGHLFSLPTIFTIGHNLLHTKSFKLRKIKSFENIEIL